MGLLDRFRRDRRTDKTLGPTGAALAGDAVVDTSDARRRGSGDGGSAGYVGDGGNDTGGGHGWFSGWFGGGSDGGGFGGDGGSGGDGGGGGGGGD